MPTFDKSSIEAYKATHGKRPQGQAAWAFTLGRNVAWTTVRFDTDFSTAKSLAMREARALGCQDVVLES